MTRPKLTPLVIPDVDGRTTIACPGPGLVTISRRAGELLVTCSVLGSLERDERTYDLVMPAQGSGIVTSVDVDGSSTPCEHKQPLITLGAASSSALNEIAGTDAADSESESADSGEFEIRAPTHGTFYRRPSPGEPSYVEVGAQVEHGQTLGLVEVMKFFSPIAFQPPPGSSSGIVRAIAADDGDEVQGGQILFRVELR